MRPRSPQSRRMIGGGLDTTSGPGRRQDADIARVDFKGRPGARRRRCGPARAGGPWPRAGRARPGRACRPAVRSARRCGNGGRRRSARDPGDRCSGVPSAWDRPEARGPGRPPSDGPIIAERGRRGGTSGGHRAGPCGDASGLAPGRQAGQESRSQPFPEVSLAVRRPTPARHRLFPGRHDLHGGSGRLRRGPQARRQ